MFASIFPFGSCFKKVVLDPSLLQKVFGVLIVSTLQFEKQQLFLLFGIWQILNFRKHFRWLRWCSHLQLFFWIVSLRIILFPSRCDFHVLLIESCIRVPPPFRFLLPGACEALQMSNTALCQQRRVLRRRAPRLLEIRVCCRHCHCCSCCQGELLFK